MAQQDNDQERDEAGEAEAEAAAKNRKKRLLIIAAIGLALVLVSVGGTLLGLWILREEPESAEPVDAVPAVPLPKPAIYYALKPPVVVDFSARGRRRFLQVEMTLMTRESDVISAVELHQPMLRNELILLIGGYQYEELQSAEGKELLRQACLQALQKRLQQEIGKPGIEQVLFTSFVMQ